MVKWTFLLQSWISAYSDYNHPSTSQIAAMDEIILILWNVENESLFADGGEIFAYP